MKKAGVIGALMLAGLSLSGCAALVIGGAAVGGMALMQERSVGHAIDDNAIAATINARFLERDPALFANLGTEVIEGRVLVVGPARSPYVREEAGRIIAGVPGVREVLNEIQVTGYDGQNIINYAEHGVIDKGVRGGIIPHVGVNAVNYAVEVLNRVVYILGVGENEAELNAAIHAARTTRGVQKVVSHVLFKDDPRRGVGVVAR